MACSYDRDGVGSMEMQCRLPVGVAAFIGRERERARLADLVSDARVMTLTGAGGCGKTRLALEFTGDVASRFPDGACWVDLQGVSDPEMVAASVAAVVGVRERADQALVDMLVEQLRDRHLLVVLDNCEHVIEACAGLVATLSSMCPQLRILATSRVPLAVEGESTFEVGPLPVPEPDAGSATAVAAADAARLFEVRARQVDTEFRIGDGNASTVAEICRRLDGIPLAIELAAARIRVLSPGQIAESLSDRFELLTGGVRGAPARQRTLEASLEWSYQLLDEVQRLALARLSVFVGSFELDAADAVVGGGGIDSGDVLGLLAGLVEQSLLQVVQGEGRARYRLLETIRLYAGQRLTELDDPDRVHDRHLAFHGELAQRARAGLNGGEPEEWMARLTADLDDLRAAMDWAITSDNLSGLVDLTEPILRFWFGRGLSAEVHRRLQAAVDAPNMPEAERARALVVAAALAGDSGAGAGAEASAHRSADQAVKAARAADAEELLAVALASRALNGTISGLSPTEQIAADVEEALGLAERCAEPATRAYVMANAVGGLVYSLSIDDGWQLLEQLLELCEEHELNFQLPAVHASMGYWPVFSGRLDRTRHHAQRGVELGCQMERPGWEATGLVGLGAADVLQGDPVAAAARLSQAREILQGQGLEGSQYDRMLRPWLAFAGYAVGDLASARAEAESLVRIGRAGGSRWDEAIGEWLLGAIAHADDDHGDVRAHWESSRTLSTDPRLPSLLGRSVLGLAELAREADDLDDAWELAHDSLETLSDHGDRIGTVEALEVIATLVLATGEPDRALRLLAASDRFHAEVGLVRVPVAAERHDSTRTAAEATLDDAEVAACWEAGTQLPLAEAVAYARRGRGQRQRPRIGWASLTPVERDVVRLVADGHTNAEIAERLFISVNTVKTHLSRVYARVDVDGRADLAAEVVRRDLR